MKYEPHEYQAYATKFILDHPVSAILLQMGLGKSVITLTAMKELFQSGEIDKALVIAPLRVARDTWPEEIRKWDHLRGLSYAVAVGTEQQRVAALLQSAQITLINRENVPWLVEHLGGRFDYDMIVIDELSSFKNHTAKRFRALLSVRPGVKRIVGLTGTPTSNGLMDLFAEYRILDLGQRLGRFISNYRDQYFVPDRYCFNRVFAWKPKPGAEEEIYRRIGDITVSMKSVDHLEMPDCVMNEIPVRMDEGERRMYEEMKERLFLRVVDSKGFIKGAAGKPPEIIIDAKNASVLSNKLSQMANGAVYAEDGRIARIHERKLDALEDLIEASTGNPLLIAYWYQHDIDRIRRRFPDVRLLRDAVDILDWNAGRIPVAAIHPAAAGHGLNLQAGGSQLVWFGLTWSLELYQQTNARLWRQGQRADTVVIHHIITEDTIDRRILDALRRKDRTQEALIDAVRAQIGGRRAEASA